MAVARVFLGKVNVSNIALPGIYSPAPDSSYCIFKYTIQSTPYLTTLLVIYVLDTYNTFSSTVT